MITVAQVLFWILVALVVGQGLLVCAFVLALWTWQRPLLADDATPKAAVILALRGGDPFLEDCIRGLLRQEYPDYEVHVVIDRAEDPASEVVQPFLQADNFHKLHVQYLADPGMNCSLKCSSIVQVVRSLDESYEIVAQLDADTIPHPTWLRELASALADERIGAATGNRWYMPNKPSLGALVRYVWNAAGVVQMYCYSIAWGGTLAVKMQVLRETDLLEKWSNAFCEDTMLYAFLKRHGYRVAFVPSLLMINREDCDLGGYFTWVRRQLLTARLYHPAWPNVVGHGVLTSVAPLVAIVLALWAWISGDRDVMFWSVAGFVAYESSVTLMLPPMEVAAQRIARGRGENTNWLSLGTVLKCLFMIPFTAVVYAFALASTCFIRGVEWRGISYRIEAPWEIRMLKYQPFESQQQQPEETSL